MDRPSEDPLRLDGPARDAGRAALAQIARVAGAAPPPGPARRAALDDVRAALDHFQRRALAANADRPVSCRAGCSHCCAQWVPEVYHFEVEALGEELLARGDRVAREAHRRLERQCALRERHEREHPTPDGAGLEERAAHLVALDVSWLRRGHSCGLLDEAGRCGVHPERPWSCRRYLVLSDPVLCRGEHIGSPFHRAFFLEPGEGIDEALARLDRALGGDGTAGPLAPRLRDWLGPRLAS